MNPDYYDYLDEYPDYDYFQGQKFSNRYGVPENPWPTAVSVDLRVGQLVRLRDGINLVGECITDSIGIIIATAQGKAQVMISMGRLIWVSNSVVGIVNESR